MKRVSLMGEVRDRIIWEEICVRVEVIKTRYGGGE